MVPSLFPFGWTPGLGGPGRDGGDRRRNFRDRISSPLLMGPRLRERDRKRSSRNEAPLDRGTCRRDDALRSVARDRTECSSVPSHGASSERRSSRASWPWRARSRATRRSCSGVAARVHMRLGLASAGGDAGQRLRVLYEDEWLIAVDKPSGLPTHETKDEGRPSLTRRRNGTWVVESSSIIGSMRAPPVSFSLRSPRKQTPPSGEVSPRARSRRPTSHSARNHRSTGRTGTPSTARSWLQPMARSESIRPEWRPSPGSAFSRPSRSAAGGSEASHRSEAQIRVHLATAGAPIVGDTRYGGPKGARLMLHAERLALEHPVTGRPLVLSSPRPDAFNGSLPTPKHPRAAGRSPGKSDPGSVPRRRDVAAAVFAQSCFAAKAWWRSGRDFRH